MQFYSYLYLVVDLIHSLLIKVMKLKVYSQLQNSVTQSVCPTDSLLNIETQTLFDTDSIITGTGTTGDTMIHSFGTSTTIGTSTVDGTGILVGILVVVAIVLGVVLDRKINLAEDLDPKLKNLDQETQD